jgi:hypothetical protein
MMCTDDVILPRWNLEISRLILSFLYVDFAFGLLPLGFHVFILVLPTTHI